MNAKLKEENTPQTSFAAAANGQVRVAIIGTGPVGVFTAFDLAKNGAYITLIGQKNSPTTNALKKQEYIELASTKTTRELEAMFANNYIPPDPETSDVAPDEDLTEIIDGQRVISKEKLAIKLKKMGNAIGNELFGAVNAKNTKNHFTQKDIHTLLSNHIRVPLYVPERDGDENKFKERLGTTRYIRFTDDPSKEPPENKVVIVATKSFSKDRGLAKKSVLPLLDPNGIVIDVANGLKRSSIPRQEQTGLRKELAQALTESQILKELNAFENTIDSKRVIGANALFAVDTEGDNPARIHVRSLLHNAKICISDTNSLFERLFTGSDIRASSPQDPLAQSLDKLGINIMNIISAVYDKSKAEIFEDQTLLNLYNNSLRELYQIADTYKVQLHRNGAEGYVEQCQRYHRKAILASSHTGDLHHSSTHKDIIQGKAKTERKFLLDALIELAERKDELKKSTSHLRILSSFMDKIEQAINNDKMDELSDIHHYAALNSHQMSDGTVTRLRLPRTNTNERSNAGITITLKNKMPFSEWRKIHENNPEYFRNIMPALLTAIDPNHRVFKNGRCVDLIKTFAEVNEQTGELDLETSDFNVFLQGIEDIKKQWEAHKKRPDTTPEPKVTLKVIEAAEEEIENAKQIVEQQYKNGQTINRNNTPNKTQRGGGSGSALHKTTAITDGFAIAHNDEHWPPRRLTTRSLAKHNPIIALNL